MPRAKVSGIYEAITADGGRWTVRGTYSDIWTIIQQGGVLVADPFGVETSTDWSINGATVVALRRRPE